VTIDTGPPWLTPRAAYVHIPFCAHHCGYCDFAVAAGQDHLVPLYAEALEAELRAALGTPRAVRTLFLGGGTPTHPPPDQLDRLLAVITHWLVVEPGGEFSIEGNPDDLTDERLAILTAHGVNRLSVGVQSFRPGLLAALDRRHRADEVASALRRARDRFPQLSVDLIFGVPGQSLADWHADLDAALAYAPDHVATYGLTYEKGTPLWKARHRGAVVPLDEDAELAMYEAAMDRLEAAAFEHYEISNFARAGCRSRHNQTYWANEAYFGFGVGAARYVGGVRELNTRDLNAYLRRALAGEPTTFQSEALPPRERALETVAVQLRRADGIDRPAFAAQTGHGLDTLVGPGLVQHTVAGLLADDGRVVRLTRRGKCVADALVADLLASAE
jgi:oxygen-independent coproporphyrinogen-3 oxidase